MFLLAVELNRQPFVNPMIVKIVRKITTIFCNCNFC